MSHPADLGGSIWKAEIARARDAASAIRNALTRIIDEQPGPLTTAMLLAKSGLALSEVEAAITHLEQIGRKAKNAQS